MLRLAAAAPTGAWRRGIALEAALAAAPPPHPPPQADALLPGRACARRSPCPWSPCPTSSTRRSARTATAGAGRAPGGRRDGERPAREQRSPTALREQRVLVVCGSGGVGKTTTAAALALRGGPRGTPRAGLHDRPVAAPRHEPGPRRLSGRPRALDLSRARPQAAAGRCRAMMLDTKRTFDALVRALRGARRGRAQRILENRFYQQVSAALAGSHEYMAMEKLLELSADERFDLVVLDTPPTRHALDFLEAPDRMHELPGHQHPALLPEALLRGGPPHPQGGHADRGAGPQAGRPVSGIAVPPGPLGVLPGVRGHVRWLQGARGTRPRPPARGRPRGFVLVASPAPPALDEALFFHRRLREKKMPFVAFVVNRVHPDPRGRGACARGGPADVTVDCGAGAAASRRSTGPAGVWPGWSAEPWRASRSTWPSPSCSCRSSKRTYTTSRPPARWATGGDDAHEDHPLLRQGGRRQDQPLGGHGRAGGGRSAIAPWWCRPTPPTAWPTLSTRTVGAHAHADRARTSTPSRWTSTRSCRSHWGVIHEWLTRFMTFKGVERDGGRGDGHPARDGRALQPPQGQGLRRERATTT